MVVTDLAAFRQTKEAQEKEDKRLSRYRLLGSRCHTAWFRNHMCCKCSTEISGAMAYIRETYITASGIVVKKYHWPVCPDYYHRKDEEERERREAETASRKAA